MSANLFSRYLLISKGENRHFGNVVSNSFHFYTGRGYTHDRRADKYPYPHDRRAGKDSYPHDRNVTDDLCSFIKLCFAFLH